VHLGKADLPEPLQGGDNPMKFFRRGARGSTWTVAAALALLGVLWVAAPTDGFAKMPPPVCQTPIGREGGGDEWNFVPATPSRLSRQVDVYASDVHDIRPRPIPVVGTDNLISKPLSSRIDVGPSLGWEIALQILRGLLTR
jgi:hypothetical protein